MSTLITAGAVVTGREILRPGFLLVESGLVRAVGAGEPPRPAVDGDVPLGDDAVVVPGFTDMHSHGGGGASFTTATVEESATAVALHQAHGTTTLVASLVTAYPDELLRQVSALAEQVQDGLLAGIHLEGPWLSPARRGAHDPGALRDPDPAEVARLLAAGKGQIRMVTLAPELAGAIPAIRQIVAAGAVAAVGHTDASYEQVRQAVAAGATVATHLFNAMRPIHHREPGPVLALLEDPRVTVEVIGDGVHLHPVLYREVCHRVNRDRVTLVTDAMAAAGMPDGSYTLGALAVDVADGIARLVGSDTIAGSTATMDRLFRFALAHGGGPADEALLRAVAQTSLNPARAMGFPDAGLRAGGPADAVVLDPDASVTGVLRQGEWVRPPSWSGGRTSPARSARRRPARPSGG